MRKIFTNTKVVVLLLVGFTLAILFNNCADAIHSKNGLSLSSLQGGSCELTLENEYKAFVYPFFRSDSTCMHCHIEGGAGLGLFSSADTSISFRAFSAAGLAKISYHATDPQHKPPYTGVQNKPAVDSWSAAWTKSQNGFLDCKSRAENGGVDLSLLTSPKKAPNIYLSQTASQILSWDLEMAQDLDEKITRTVPAVVSIEVRTLYQNGLSIGYIFSSPSIQLKDASKQVVIEGLFFQINGQLISSQTTFTSLSRIATGSSLVSLMPNIQANTLIAPISTTDTFQLYIRRIALSSGVDESPAPLTPILSVKDELTGSSTLTQSTTVNVSILRDSSINRWCLSESPVRPISTEAICLNGLSGPGIVNGWSLSRPLSFQFQSGDGNKTLYLWVANQYLKINEQPATVQMQLDTVPPQPAVIASINGAATTQVAAMSVTHANEADVAGWCVIEQNYIKAAPGKPNLNDKCWSWTEKNAKPTTVGFKSGGKRDVWIYVRDRAGNVSNASNMVEATNNKGAITYTQLTASTGGPMAIFQNRCFTCHGSSANPGFSKLQLFSYAAAVEAIGSGLIIERINNPLSPMPNVNGGLMPQAERDLIKLWGMPEEGNMPLP